jgi:hypothetical protein
MAVGRISWAVAFSQNSWSLRSAQKMARQTMNAVKDVVGFVRS